MDANQFNTLITNLQTLTKNIDSYGQQTAQLTATVENTSQSGANAS